MDIRSKEAFEKIINPESFQVFLMSVPIPKPFSFAIHLFFVTNVYGELHRFEVWHKPHCTKTSRGHVHKDLFNPWDGINTWIPPIPASESHITWLHTFTGKEAKTLESVLLRSLREYPFSYKYRFVRGPNSNTYVEWILTQSPGCDFSLPASAIGKNYLKRPIDKDINE